MQIPLETELNDILPDTIVSSEEIDYIFTLLGSENIKIVDSKEAAEELMRKNAAAEAPAQKTASKDPGEPLDELLVQVPHVDRRTLSGLCDVAVATVECR